MTVSFLLRIVAAAVLAAWVLAPAWRRSEPVSSADDQTAP